MLGDTGPTFAALDRDRPQQPGSRTGLDQRGNVEGPFGRKRNSGRRPAHNEHGKKQDGERREARHPPILHWERKTILKVLALTLTLWAVPSLACAADLVVGVVHDTDGFPVSGASVTVRDAGGAAAGSGTTGGDGTFAVEPSADVATVDVRCRYCLGMTVPHVNGRPVVAVIRRFAALRDRGISAAEARLLPYAAVTDLAALMPFAVASYGAISDRGLAGARGAVISDGFALYRATDGVDVSTAIPSHGTATIAQTDPAQAGAYGAYGAGGLFSIDTLDQSAGLVRADGSSAGDVALRAGNELRGAFENAGGDDAATRAVLEGTLPAAGGTLDLRAVSASGAGADASSVATTLTVPLRSTALTTAFSLTRSQDALGPENDSLAALSLQAGEVTFGLRAQRESGIVLGFAPGAQDDARAFVQLLHDDGNTRIFASLAAAAGGETYLRFTSTRGAVLPVLSVSTHLAPWLDVHADSVDALLASPMYLLFTLPNGTAVDRSHLSDAGLGFDDGNRLRIDAMVFRQTVTGSDYGTIGGSGVSLVWQIAPALALRSWALISQAGGDNTSRAYHSVYATGTASLDRNVTWLTAGSVLRVDAIWRGGYLEGDVSVPVGAHIRLVAGTRRDGASRVVTAGISWP